MGTRLLPGYWNLVNTFCDSILPVLDVHMLSSSGLDVGVKFALFQNSWGDSIPHEPATRCWDHERVTSSTHTPAGLTLCVTQKSPNLLPVSVDQ